MRRAIILACLLAPDLYGVKFFKDVLPAVGAGTTVLLNVKTLARLPHHAKRVGKAVKNGVKKAVGK